MYIFLETTDLDASFKLYIIDVRPLFIAEMSFEVQTVENFLQNIASVKKTKFFFEKSIQEIRQKYIFEDHVSSCSKKRSKPN